MDELKQAMKQAFANSYAFYLKAQFFHWNVEGILFPQLHGLFDTIYSEVYDSIDPFAENIRKLDAYAPVSLSELYRYKTVDENETLVVLLRDMLATLIMDNDKVIASLNRVFALGTRENKQGLCDFIAGRLDVHEKHGWMLRSSAKNIG